MIFITTKSFRTESKAIYMQGHQVRFHRITETQRDRETETDRDRQRERERKRERGRERGGIFMEVFLERNEQNK